MPEHAQACFVEPCNGQAYKKPHAFRCLIFQCCSALEPEPLCHLYFAAMEEDSSTELYSKPEIYPGMPADNPAIPLFYRRKIRFSQHFEVYGHHRGGWKYVTGDLLQQLTVEGDGTLCFSDVGDVVFCKKTQALALSEPWVGFAHQTPKANYPHFPDLKRMVADSKFKEALPNCRGLFALSSVVKDFLVEHLSPAVPVCLVYYPVAPFKREYLFDMQRFEKNEQKRILFVGEFMRNFQAIYDLDAPGHLQKTWIKAKDVDINNLFDINCQPYKLKQNASVKLWKEQVSDREYDCLLRENVVFLNMFDAGACTTMNECAARGTPFVINRLPAIEEYLGKDYPLFYDNLGEASSILADNKLLLQGSRYLLESSSIKQKLSGKTFMESFANSAIYRSLELPLSQADPKLDHPQTRFPRFDLTVAISIAGELNGLSHQLDKLSGCFSPFAVQVILWCSSESLNSVKKWCEPYRKSLFIDIIESSRIYSPADSYLAVKELMFSKTLLVVNHSSVLSNHEDLRIFAKERSSARKKAAFVLDGQVVHKLEKKQMETEESSPEATPPFDVSLVMCQYKRVEEMTSILEGLSKQDYTGRFQLIIWNNNEEEHDRVKSLCGLFAEKLNIDLIQSTRNYFCAIRFAVRHLMRSDLMLIIDDDIQPRPGYIQRFVDKFQQYGPRATICCRGHIFPDHRVDEENPHTEWELEQKQESKLLQFRSQSSPDCKVHFIHADNLLVSKALLSEVLDQFELPCQEFIVVDDYWLSFVLSHHLGVSLWRVKSDDVMHMTKSGDDPAIALYHQSPTRDHRIDFYVYHMRQGWPASRPLPYSKL